MQGQLKHELEVEAPASKVWEIYGSLELGRLVVKLLPNLIERVDVVQGDGGVGTILSVTFPPEIGFGVYKEEFVVIDNEKRRKVTEVVEGGYLELGFTLYRITLQIEEKEGSSSIIKSIVEYEFDEQTYPNNASLVTTAAVETIAHAIAKYLTEDKHTTKAEE